MQLTISFKIFLILNSPCLLNALQELSLDITGRTTGVDYYAYRHVVAEGVQKALDECREKFKWDRWNCPKKAFLDILDRNPLPANKELGLTHAFIASGIVLSLARSCSYGTNNVCGCSSSHSPGNSKNHTKFVWRGCDEIVKFAFQVSKMYLDQQDKIQDESAQKVNAHNYEVGRLAVRKNMKKVCKCHGMSGSCQFNTCWNTVPDMSKVGVYLRNQYRLAAKIGAMSTEETNLEDLNREIKAITPEKLVFVDPSPEYCYDQPKLGINGTLGRYCSRAVTRADGSKVPRHERDSCHTLCTKCGYKIAQERIVVEKQCDCRFVYCCKVECRRCTETETTYKCVRHS